LAKAGIELARMMLFETADSDIRNKLDFSVYLAKGSDEQVRGAAISLAWGGVAEVTRKLGDGTVTVTVCPVNVRNSLKDIIDVNNREKTDAMWEPLFEAAGVPFENRDALIDCLLDWVDQDELTHLSGAESAYYESLDPPYRSKNAAIDTVDELALIKGFDEKLPDAEITIYEALSEYVTTYETGNQININAAGRNEMMAIGIDAQLADEIIVQRQGPDLKERTEDDVLFDSLDDPPLTMLPQNVRDKITFQPAGGLYSILARGKVGDIEHAIACVVKWENNKNMTILRWIEGDALQANLISN
jgi:type II secretory pathway component PulK